MANNVSAVSILKPESNGVVWYAPLGTTLPTSINDELDPAFKTVGYLSSDGIEKADNFEEGEGQQAYGGDTVVSGTPSMNPSITFTIWETGNPDALALAYHQDDIDPDSTINSLSYKLTDRVPDDCAIVLAFQRSNGVVELDVYEHAVFGARGDTTRDNENPDAIEVTWNFRKGADGAYGRVYLGKKGTTTE